MSLSIIIPCKNEEQNIEQTIETICSYISGKIHDYQINVINDLVLIILVIFLIKFQKNKKIKYSKMKNVGWECN